MATDRGLYLYSIGFVTVRVKLRTHFPTKKTQKNGIQTNYLKDEGLDAVLISYSIIFNRFLKDDGNKLFPG